MFRKYEFELYTSLIPFLALLISFLFYTYVLNLHIYGADGDYYYQHLPLYNYIRQSFYETHNLFPQMNMRHGGVSSFANLVYYGSMNPFVWLSYFFPFITMQTYFELLPIVLIPFIAFMNYKILDFYNFDKLISSTIAIAFSILPTFIFHLQGQVPFVLFYPFFLLSIWSLQKIDKRQVVFILSFSQIYYLNFTFAASTSFFLFLYLLVLIHTKRLTQLSYMKYIIKIIILNIVALMIGFLPFIVQALASSYRNVTTGGFLINKEVISDLFITNNPIAFAYDYQLYLYTLIAFFSLIFIRNFKESYLLIFLFFALLIAPITKALNFFLYFDPKIFIYFTPFMMIAFTYSISQLKKLVPQSKIIYLFFFNFVLAIIVYLFQVPEYYTQTFLLISMQNIVVVMLLFNKKALHSALIMFVLTISSFFLYSELSNQVYAEINSCGSEYTLTRTSDIESTNVVKCSEDFTMTQYTSILNENLTLYTYEQLDNKFTSWYIQSYLFESELNKQILSIDTNPDINPFIKGVGEEFIFYNNHNTFTESDIVTHVENEDASKEYEEQYTPDIVDTNSYTLSTGEELVYDVSQYCKPNNYIDLTYTLSGNKQLKINGIDHNYGNDFETTTYQNTIECEDQTSVTFIANQPLTISDVKIDVYTLSELNEYGYNYSVPYNVDIKFNESISFDINMDQNGMLVTTIPYDKGFNVYLDNDKVETSVVNQYFLGAKIDSGVHHVEITFTMTGFYLGLCITILGLLITYFVFFKNTIKRI